MAVFKPKGAAAKTNLLKTQMDCICKEYRPGIFPELGKCARGALETLFGGIVAEKSTFALDFSDISKEFGGRGIEEMAKGWDGIRALAGLGKVRFISGRPRKLHPPDPLQLLLAL
jgi:hypothetical protein